jgi:hypothetical protein
MGKKHICIQRGEETIKVEIRDGTHRVLHRATYRLYNKGDIYNMLSMLEKFTPYTITQIINWKNDWM